MPEQILRWVRIRMIVSWKKKKTASVSGSATDLVSAIQRLSKRDRAQHEQNTK